MVVRRLDRLPDFGLLTRREVINWIAFGDGDDGDLTGYYDALDRWSLASVDPKASGMVRALWSIARGEPFGILPPDPDEPDWMRWERLPGSADLEDLARALVARRGGPTMTNERERELAGEMADELQAELENVSNRQGIFAAADDELKDAESRRRISPAQPPSGGSYRGRDAGIWYERSDILSLWPKTAVDELPARPDPTQARDVQQRQDKVPTPAGAPKTALDAKARKPGRPTVRDAVLARFDEKHRDAKPARFDQRGDYAKLAAELIAELSLNERRDTVARWISHHVRGREADKL